MGVAGSTWQYTAVDGSSCCTWQYMVVYGSIRESMAVLGSICQYMGVHGSIWQPWQFMAAHVSTWEYKGVYGSAWECVGVHGSSLQYNRYTNSTSSFQLVRLVISGSICPNPGTDKTSVSNKPDSRIAAVNPPLLFTTSRSHT